MFITLSVNALANPTTDSRPVDQELVCIECGTVPPEGADGWSDPREV
jgi:hypothetical protein